MAFQLATPRFPLRMFFGSFLPSIFLGEEKEVSKVLPFKEKVLPIFKEMGYFAIQSTKPDTVGKSSLFGFHPGKGSGVRMKQKYVMFPESPKLPMYFLFLVPIQGRNQPSSWVEHE